MMHDLCPDGAASIDTTTIIVDCVSRGRVKRQYNNVKDCKPLVVGSLGVHRVVMEEVFQNGNYQREANANMTVVETRKEVSHWRFHLSAKSICLSL